MKKTIFILMLLLSISLSLNAEALWYKAYKYNYHTKNMSTGEWNPWNKWEKCDIDVKIDTDKEVVVIYSNKTQTYRITEYVTALEDVKGGSQIKMKIIDQDGDKGDLRLRVDKNDVLQIYIDFPNVTMVYCVRIGK